MNEDYIVTCGSWNERVTVDRSIFESHEEACFEAATRCLEKHFLTSDYLQDKKQGITKDLTRCLVRPADSLDNNKDDYIVFPPKIYENIGVGVVKKYFKQIM
jgi:hypothetical protein